MPRYAFKSGSKVELRGDKFVVLERYYPNGFFGENEAAYTLYPPGKKKAVGTHFWAYERNLRPR